MLSIVVDKTYSPRRTMAALIVIHNFAVLGLFALKNITMAEIFDRVIALPGWRFQKRQGPWRLAFGPVLAGIFW